MKSPWFSVLAGIVSAAVGGAAVGTAAAGINSLVHGQTPWDDPGGFFAAQAKGGAMGLGTGALTAGLGSALGPALGQAAQGLGIGENAGTTAVEAGAVTPTDLGVVPSQAANLIGSTGTQATESGVANALGNIGKQSLIGAGVGVAKDPRNPLQGAVTGAVGGALGSGLNYVGQATGITTGGMPSRDFEFKYQPEAPHYSLNAQQLATPPATLASTINPPSLGGQLGAGAYGLASRGLTGIAQQGVGSMMTPRPPMPQQSPWPGIVPYWMRQGYSG